MERIKYPRTYHLPYSQSKTDDDKKEEIPEVSLEEGKSQIKAYGVFSTIPDVDDPEHFRGRYLLMSRLTGKGINLY